MVVFGVAMVWAQWVVVKKIIVSPNALLETIYIRKNNFCSAFVVLFVLLLVRLGWVGWC